MSHDKTVPSLGCLPLPHAKTGCQRRRTDDSTQPCRLEPASYSLANASPLSTFCLDTKCCFGATMDDPTEARRLVESIRYDLGIEEDGTLSKVGQLAQNALHVLSEELYSKPTRFLLELIQNADDNKYAGDVSPQLSIVYRPGFLWFGINEIGFSAANLRALCAVGESTKKIEGNRKGYIGEKGIGFKAVYKVADVVWIQSRALSVSL